MHLVCLRVGHVPVDYPEADRSKVRCWSKEAARQAVTSALTFLYLFASVATNGADDNGMQAILFSRQPDSFGILSGVGLHVAASLTSPPCRPTFFTASDCCFTVHLAGQFDNSAVRPRHIDRSWP